MIASADFPFILVCADLFAYGSQFSLLSNISITMMKFIVVVSFSKILVTMSHIGIGWDGWKRIE